MVVVVKTLLGVNLVDDDLEGSGMGEVGVDARGGGEWWGVVGWLVGVLLCWLRWLYILLFIRLLHLEVLIDRSHRLDLLNRDYRPLLTLPFNFLN